MTETSVSLNDLLADMRRQVEYSDKITMPVPLYERMKTAITAMGDASVRKDEGCTGTPAPATSASALRASPINDTLIDRLCELTPDSHEAETLEGMLEYVAKKRGWTPGFGRRFISDAINVIHGARSEISVHPALAAAAEILANFKTEGNKLEEWQACYAKLFTQMNEICNQKRESVDLTEIREQLESVYSLGHTGDCKTHCNPRLTDTKCNCPMSDLEEVIGKITRIEGGQS